MIGQAPRARLRLIATDSPDFAATRDLYCRIAATRETDPDPLPPSWLEDWPDAPHHADAPRYRDLELIALFILGMGLGAFITALAHYNG